ncbi:MAG: hypothetical protein FJ026_01455 [Chloroflexi bacterium]|nr:hypothetical protein [Chloroflexota bacterium]
MVWEERNRIYHRAGLIDGWLPTRSVAVGEQPSVATDAAGLAHLAFVNEFGGNYEIYYCRWNGSTWSLPRNVSNTSGVSSSPRLAVATDGTPHIVWADNTPGYTVIYHAYWNGTYWLNEPIPHALGGAPAVSVGADGKVHVVWQDRDTPNAPYEIYYSLRDGLTWSLPEDLSDTPGQQSIIPNLSVDRVEAHVVWQERVDGKYAIFYTRGRVGLWSVPERVSPNEAEAYLPSLAVNVYRTVYAGWDEGQQAVYRQRAAGRPGWSACTAVVSDVQGVTDLHLAIDGRGQLHAVWAGRVSADNWDVFYQKLSSQLFLPMTIKQFASGR